MKKCIIVVSAVLVLIGCKQKSKEEVENDLGVIVLKALNPDDSSRSFSTKDTVKIIQVLILQEQIVKQSYFTKDENLAVVMRILAENELAYQNAYHEEWIETIQRPHGTKPKKRKKWNDIFHEAFTDVVNVFNIMNTLYSIYIQQI